MVSEFDRIYDRMTGRLPPAQGVENVYDGPCGALMDQAGAALRRLEGALERAADPQAALWLRSIVDAYVRMQRLMCAQAYQYGQEAGRAEMRQAMEGETEALAVSLERAGRSWE